MIPSRTKLTNSTRTNEGVPGGGSCDSWDLDKFESKADIPDYIHFAIDKSIKNIGKICVGEDAYCKFCFAPLSIAAGG